MSPGFLTASERVGRKLRNNVAIPTLKVEVASSPEAHHHGLMYRRSLSTNSGMLFDFGQTKPLSFWMQNTYVPLQIAFIDSTGKVGQIERMSPLCTKATRSHASYRYALEVNDGWFDRHEIRIGAQLQLPGAQPQPQQQAPAAVIVPFKDILREANRHYDLRLLIGYQTKDGEEAAPQVIRTPFTFVNTAEGDHDGVIKAAIEGPAVQGESGPAVRKVSQPADPTEDRIRSFIVDNIVSISDLQGNPITSVAQVAQLAKSQPRPTAATRYDWLKFAQITEEEYTTRVYVNPTSGYDVWGFLAPVGIAPNSYLAKGNFKTLDQALEVADTCVRSRLNNYAAPPNVAWALTSPSMVMPTAESRYLYSVTLYRNRGGSWHTSEMTVETEIPGQEVTEEAVRRERNELPVIDPKITSDVFNDKWRSLDPKRKPNQVQGLPLGFRYFQGFNHTDWFVIDPFGHILAHSPIWSLAVSRALVNIRELTKQTRLPKDMILVDSGGKEADGTSPRYAVFDKEKLLARADKPDVAVFLAIQPRLPVESGEGMEYKTFPAAPNSSSGLRVKRCQECRRNDGFGDGWVWAGEAFKHLPECSFFRGIKPFEDYDLDEANRMLAELQPKSQRSSRLSHSVIECRKSNKE